MILETYLKQLGNKKPIFSGWSLGASPAILSAYDFYLKTNIKPQVITFGGLKIAYRKKDAEKLKSRLLITEYTQANDSITWLLPFCHRIRKAQIGEKFNLKKAFNTEFYHCNYDKFLE